MRPSRGLAQGWTAGGGIGRVVVFGGLAVGAAGWVLRGLPRPFLCAFSPVRALALSRLPQLGFGGRSFCKGNANHYRPRQGPPPHLRLRRFANFHWRLPAGQQPRPTMAVRPLPNWNARDDTAPARPYPPPTNGPGPCCASTTRVRLPGGAVQLRRPPGRDRAPGRRVHHRPAARAGHRQRPCLHGPWPLRIAGLDTMSLGPAQRVAAHQPGGALTLVSATLDPELRCWPTWAGWRWRAAMLAHLALHRASPELDALGLTRMPSLPPTAVGLAGTAAGSHRARAGVPAAPGGAGAPRPSASGPTSWTNLRVALLAAVHPRLLHRHDLHQPPGWRRTGRCRSRGRGWKASAAAEVQRLHASAVPSRVQAGAMAVGEDAHRHHAGPLVDPRFHANGSTMSAPAHVQHRVAVVGDDAGRGEAWPPSSAKRRTSLRCRHRDHFHRQWKGAQPLHQLEASAMQTKRSARSASRSFRA